MILQRLYELAERENLLADVAFEAQDIAFVINLADDGSYLSLDCFREERLEPPLSGKGKPRKKLVKGKPLSVPKAHGNPANPGFARYFADTLERVVPVSSEAKHTASRKTFWKQIGEAAQHTADASLAAVRRFGQDLAEDAALCERVAQELAEFKRAAGDRCTFAVHRDAGRTIVQVEPIRAWFRTFASATLEKRAEAGPVGLCQVTCEWGPIATTHSIDIKLPLAGSHSKGVKVVSNNKDAFKSYGLEDSANACIGWRGAEGYGRAIQHLLHGVPGRRSTLTVGPNAFLFWTRDAAAAFDAGSLLDNPDAESVARLLESPAAGRPATADPNDFYCLVLSGNAARAVVRDYLESPLADAKRHLAAWFGDLAIYDDWALEITSLFSIRRLAAASVREAKEIAPNVAVALMEAALKGHPLPDSILAACCGRLRAEGTAGFRPERLALIRLCLNRVDKEYLMPASLDDRVSSPGYACGQLLAFLARCQSPRDFGASAQILERFFGAASTSPRSVFPVLLRLNRHHIKRVRDEMPGFAFNLEEDLEDRLAPFKTSEADDPDFPAILTLHEQGRFALGFYHQRAEFRRQSQARKAADAATE